MNNESKIINVVCGKCDGKGKLFWLGHVENGKCFACAGSGTVSAQSVSVRNAARFRAAVTVDSLIEAGDRVLTSNPGWARQQVRRAAADMLIVADTVWARRVLADMPSGLRAAVIAVGRELKAG